MMEISIHPGLEPLLNQIHNADAVEMLRWLPDDSIDLILTDPPYGLGLEKEWDQTPDVSRFLAEAYRVLKDGAFFAFTNQMPYALDWLIPLKQETKFKYKEHVTWLKRNTGAYAAGLCHMHEELFIYCKGRAKFYEVKGRYSDTKVPGLMFDAISIDGIKRYIDDLRRQIETGVATKKDSGKRHKAHKRRGGWETENSPEFVNFTNVWSYLPENLKAQVNSEFIHASRKPVKLLERALTVLSARGMVVVDPFMGSGSTATACRNTGRHYIGSELSPEFCQIARELITVEFGKVHNSKPIIQDYEGLPMFEYLDTLESSEE